MNPTINSSIRICAVVRDEDGIVSDILYPDDPNEQEIISILEKINSDNRIEPKKLASFMDTAKRKGVIV